MIEWMKSIGNIGNLELRISLKTTVGILEAKGYWMQSRQRLSPFIRIFKEPFHDKYKLYIGRELMEINK